MKRLVCAASTAAVLTLLAGAAAEDTPSIKQVMTKLHKGANAPLGKLKAALKGDSPDWESVQDLSKDFVILGAALSKNDPPRGEKSSYKQLADAYFEDSKELDAGAKAKDLSKTRAALAKIGASCKDCHTAHKGK